jgi:hypothetical protein
MELMSEASVGYLRTTSLKSCALRTFRMARPKLLVVSLDTQDALPSLTSVLKRV